MLQKHSAFINTQESENISKHFRASQAVMCWLLLTETMNGPNASGVIDDVMRLLKKKKKSTGFIHLQFCKMAKWCVTTVFYTCSEFLAQHHRAASAGHHHTLTAALLLGDTHKYFGKRQICLGYVHRLHYMVLVIHITSSVSSLGDHIHIYIHTHNTPSWKQQLFPAMQL